MSKLWTYHVLAHCRRTDSDRPHRCCHLPNSVEFIDCVQTHAAALHGSRRILSIRDNGPGDAPKCLFSRGVGGSRPPLNMWFLPEFRVAR